MRGKTCSALFFSSREDEYYQTVITFDFVSEILDQIGPDTPSSFGHGIAGVGALLTHLATSGILDVDVNDLVSDFDERLFKTIGAGLIADTSLTTGLSGYGIYLLGRLDSGLLTNEDRKVTSYWITYIANRLLREVSSALRSQSDLSLWTGLGGVYMFLSHASERGLFEDDDEVLFASVVSEILGNLVARSPEWDHLPLYFALANSGDAALRFIQKDLIWSAFDDFLEKSVPHPIGGVTEAAFYAALLKYCSFRPHGSQCGEISLRLADQVSAVINTTGLRQIYPYNLGTRNVDVGLRAGAGGVALAINALTNNNFDWLRIFGYKVSLQ